MKKLHKLSLFLILLLFFSCSKSEIKSLKESKYSLTKYSDEEYNLENTYTKKLQWLSNFKEKSLEPEIVVYPNLEKSKLKHSGLTILESDEFNQKQWDKYIEELERSLGKDNLIHNRGDFFYFKSGKDYNLIEINNSLLLTPKGVEVIIDELKNLEKIFKVKFHLDEYRDYLYMKNKLEKWKLVDEEVNNFNLSYLVDEVNSKHKEFIFNYKWNKGDISYNTSGNNIINEALYEITKVDLYNINFNYREKLREELLKIYDTYDFDSEYDEKGNVIKEVGDAFADSKEAVYSNINRLVIEELERKFQENLTSIKEENWKPLESTFNILTEFNYGSGWTIKPEYRE